MDVQIGKEKLLETVHRARKADLIRMSAGNLSVRLDRDRIAITPSGIPYRSMEAEQISIIDLKGNLLEGPRPSSETPMHTAVYRAVPRVESIVHTHSIHAMVFAHLREDVPLTNIELLVCGAPLPVAPWACPGTKRAGEVTVELFRQRPELAVILLRQHGLVAVGETLDQAFQMAYNAEIGLEVHHKASLLGEVQALSEEQIAEIKKVYGV